MIKDNRGSAKVIILVVVSVITVACIIIGTWMHIGNFGFRLFGFNSMSDDSNKKTTTVNVDEPFDSLDIKMSIGDIFIKEGDKAIVEITFADTDLYPDVEVKNGVLSIDQSGKSGTFNFVSCNSGSYSGKITVTLPKDMFINRLDIKQNMGDIEFVDIDMDNSAIDSDLGDVKAENVTVKGFMDADLSLGDFKMTNCTIEKIDVEDDLGDIRIEGALKEAKLQCDLGDVKVENSNSDAESKMDLETDLGDVKYNGNNQGNKYTLNNN